MELNIGHNFESGQTKIISTHIDSIWQERYLGDILIQKALFVLSVDIGSDPGWKTWPVDII